MVCWEHEEQAFLCLPQTAPVNQPTWTGRSGGSGAPRFGATSNQRLARASSSELGDSEGLAAGASAEARRGAGAGLGRFGGGLAGTTGGLAPSSSVLLARLRERQAAVNAAASSAARNDPEVFSVHIFLCLPPVPQCMDFIALDMHAAQEDLRLSA